MCDPITIAAVVTTTAAGTYKAYSENQEGKAQQAYYNYLSEQSRIEGQTALDIGNKRSEAALKQGDLQSQSVQDVASQEGKQLKEQQARFSSSQKAIMASQGVTGVTAQDIALDTFNKQRLDELNLRYNADVKSYEAKVGARYGSYQALEEAKYNNFASQNLAGQYSFAGKNARKAGQRQAIGTLLGTAATLAFTAKNPFGTKAVAGKGDYGSNTPKGVRDMGTYSKVKYK
jgi:hypothetical protein